MRDECSGFIVAALLNTTPMTAVPSANALSADAQDLEKPFRQNDLEL